MILALAEALSISIPTECTSAQNAPLRQAIAAVVRATTTDWTEAFAARSLSYIPPRLNFLCPPVGHPSRGSGYYPGLGLALDLGDFAGIEHALPAEALGIWKLIIAHEIGHHVQSLAGSEAAADEPRELQADCYAGWWLARGDQVRDLDQIRGRLAKAVQILSALQTGAIRLGADSAEGSPGSLDERLEAIGRGMTAATPWAC